MHRTTAAHEQLTVSWREFQTTWRDSQSSWKDEVAVQFQKRFMAEFEAEIPEFLVSLEELRDELKRARRELS